MIRQVVDVAPLRELCAAWREVAQQERRKADDDSDELMVITTLAIADTIDVATEELMRVLARIGYMIRTRDRGSDDTTKGCNDE